MPLEALAVAPLFIVFGLFIALILFLDYQGIVGYRRALERGENRYRIVKYWRNDLAKNWYRLEQLSRFGLYSCTGYRGNIKWAKQTAKHYECKIVEEEDETDD